MFPEKRFVGTPVRDAEYIQSEILGQSAYQGAYVPPPVKELEAAAATLAGRRRLNGQLPLEAYIGQEGQVTEIELDRILIENEVTAPRERMQYVLVAAAQGRLSGRS